MLIHSPTELRSILMRAHEAGFQTATHAIGDAAIRLVVESLEEVQDSAPRKGARHRIEHYELPDADVLRRTRAAGIVSCCQPNLTGHWSGSRNVYDSRLGEARSAANNPFQTILRAGIPLCFGSDGMPYGPLFGIHWAVNGFFEDQHISPEDAIRAATAGGAYASFSEDETGTLEAGKLADFVILRGDPFATPEWIAPLRIRTPVEPEGRETRLDLPHDVRLQDDDVSRIFAGQQGQVVHVENADELLDRGRMIVDANVDPAVVEAPITPGLADDEEGRALLASFVASGALSRPEPREEPHRGVALRHLERPGQRLQ